MPVRRGLAKASFATLCSAGLALLGLGSADAGDWQLDNSISVTTSYSDNVDLDRDEDSGFLLSVDPRLSLEGKGARVSGSLAYSPSFFARRGGSDDIERVNHYLNGNFTSNLIRNRLFLDASASAGLISDSTGDNFGTDASDYGDDASQTYSLSVSPYTRHRFGSYANSTLRAEVNRVGGSGNASDIQSTGRTLSANLSGGSRFSRFPWSLQASANEVEYDDRDDNETDKRRSVTGSLGYRITRKWRVDGNAGYEDIEVLTDRSDTSGATYSATIFWTPTPRTKAEAMYGHRYFGDEWSLSAQHRSRRTGLTLDASREVTSARRRFLESRSPLFGGPGVDRDALEELSDDVLLVDPSSEDFLSTRVGFTASITGRRTTVSASADWDQRDYEVSGDEEDVISLSLRATRRIAGTLTANADARWQDVDARDGNDSQHWRLGMGLSRQVGRHSSVSIDLSRQERDGDDAAQDYVENRIGVSLTTRMF